MFFFFTCGTHTFSSPLKNTSHIPPLQCQNCGNHSARLLKRWEWFTFCFIPVIPFSLKPYKEVGCPVCNFYQDVKYRPDVAAMLDGGQGVAMGGVGAQGGGHNGGPPGQGGYAQQGVPQYK